MRLPGRLSSATGGYMTVMATTVRDNPERSRYELLVDGRLAGFTEYRPGGDAVVFPHTVVAPALRGRGLGEILVREALDDARSRGWRIVPACWYVAQFVDEHPGYEDLLAA